MAVCQYGNFPLNHSNHHKTLEINGIGKYPHLLVEDETCISANANLDFGQNVIGQSVTKYVSIINMTEVATSYFIERQAEIPIFDTSFNCLQVIGCLQPFEKQKIPVRTEPKLENSLTIKMVGKIKKKQTFVSC